MFKNEGNVHEMLGAKQMLVPITKITVGHRLRSDFGNLNALAESIKNHGLLHPIVIDSDYNLVAGGRRLMAHQILRRDDIEAKMLSDLSEKELRILELEENIQRKDLTEFERSKNLVKLAEAKREAIEESQSVESKWTDSVHLNNPSKVGDRRISDELGIPRQTIRDAKQHVAAIEKYPELEEMPKHKAISLSKELDKISEDKPEARANVINLIRERNKKIIDSPEGKEPNEYISFCAEAANKYSQAIYGILTVPTTEEYLNAWLQMLDGDAVTPDHMISKISEAIDWLDIMRSFLIKNRRKVKR